MEVRQRSSSEYSIRSRCFVSVRILASGSEPPDPTPHPPTPLTNLQWLAVVWIPIYHDSRHRMVKMLWTHEAQPSESATHFDHVMTAKHELMASAPLCGLLFTTTHQPIRKREAELW